MIILFKILASATVWAVLALSVTVLVELHYGIRHPAMVSIATIILLIPFLFLIWRRRD